MTKFVTFNSIARLLEDVLVKQNYDDKNLVLPLTVYRYTKYGRLIPTEKLVDMKKFEYLRAYFDSDKLKELIDNPNQRQVCEYKEPIVYITSRIEKEVDIHFNRDVSKKDKKKFGDDHWYIEMKAESFYVLLLAYKYNQIITEGEDHELIRRVLNILFENNECLSMMYLYQKKENGKMKKYYLLKDL